MLITTQNTSETLQTATTYLSEHDPILKEIILQIGPCTLQPNPNIFEALIDAIISQQISVKAADTLLARIRAIIPGGMITPESCATLEVEMLRACGLTTPKARYIRNLIEHVLSEKIQLESLPAMADEDIINQLVAIKGIGRWTAEMILIFSLLRTDVLPVDDLGLVEAVRFVYQLPARPTRKEMGIFGERWRPYRTIATWYLWAYRRLTQNNTRTKTRIVSL